MFLIRFISSCLLFSFSFQVGVFRSASKEVLETREMKKAKRRGVTGDKVGHTAFLL